LNANGFKICEDEDKNYVENQCLQGECCAYTYYSENAEHYSI